MTKHIFPTLCRRLVLLLIAIITFGAQAAIRQKEVLRNNSSSEEFELRGDRVYFVTSDVTYSARGTHSAMHVKSGVKAIIYIANGCTLTVYGGDGDGRHGAGAGIKIEDGGTLYVTGGGTLKANGGKAGNGADGGDGGNAHLNVSDKQGWGGQGGSGGFGGGGAAAGIGGAGGDGHLALAGPTADTKPLNKGGDFDWGGRDGSNTAAGASGSSMGYVYVVGNVKVYATPGAASSISGNHGNWGGSDNDSGSGWVDFDYSAGGGGPGGGGGAGYGAQEGIGGGAPGAQCGATGGSGGSYANGWFHGRQYRYGEAGAGGKGAVDGKKNTGSRPNEKGGSGGGQSADIGSHGGKGYVYAIATNQIKSGRSEITTIKEADIDSDLRHFFSFNAQGGNGGATSCAFYTGGPLTNVNIPNLEGNTFCGYYTEPRGGQRIFDSEGRPCCLPEFLDNTTLYAQWTGNTAINVTRNEKYTGPIEEVFTKASVGDLIRLAHDIDHNITISKAITLDFNGFSARNITVGDITSGDLNLINGTMGNLNANGTDARYVGSVVLFDMEVDNIFADGHNVFFEKGFINGNFVNQAATGKEAKLSRCIINGNETFVKGQINQLEGLACGNVLLQGGNYIYRPDSAELKVIIPESHRLTKNAEAAYPYAVEQRADFLSYVDLKNEHIATTIKANDKTELTCHFRLMTLRDGLIAIVGSTDHNPDQAYSGFGLYVDGKRRRFVFAAGTGYEYSPDGLVNVNQDYYITLKRGHLEVKTSASQKGDYFHRDIAIFQAQYSDKTLILGGVNGGSNNQKDDIMRVYDFRVWEGDNELIHLKPACGFKDGKSSDTGFCLYDVKHNKTYYNSNNALLTSGMIGLCSLHPSYRIAGSGQSAYRECVLCGYRSAPEPFVQATNVMFTPATVEGLTRSVLHWAEAEGECAEHVEESTKMPREIKNMKFFRLELYKGAELIACYEPHACVDYYIIDKKNHTRATVSGGKVESNLVLQTSHEMETVKNTNNLRDRACQHCFISNSLLNFKQLVWTDKLEIEGESCEEIFNDSPYNKTSRSRSYTTITNWQDDHHDEMHEWTVVDFSGTELAHYLPSKFGKRPCVYNTVTGKILPLRFRNNGQELTSEHLDAYCHIETCLEHKYLSKTFTEVDGVYYRSCMICNEVVKSENYISLNNTQYVSIKYKPTSNSRVEIDDVKNSSGQSDIEFGNEVIMCKSTRNTQLFGVNIYESGKLVRHYVPACRDGKYGLFETLKQEFYPRENSQGSEIDQVLPCQHHPYVDIEKATDAFGIETWKSHCQVCDQAIGLTSDQPYITTNGSDYFDLGYKTTSYNIRTTFSFEVNAFENHEAMNTVYGAQESNRNDAAYHLDIHPVTHGPHFHIGSQEKADDFDQMEPGTPYFVKMTTDSASLYMGENAEGKLLFSETFRTWNNPDVPLGIGALVNNDQSYSNIRIKELCIFEGNDLVHRYLPSMWGGTPCLYDAITDKFIKSANGTAKGYVPTCQFHRYFVMESEKEGNETVLYRHCKLCDARFAVGGLKVKSEEDLRAHIYKEEEGHTLYLDKQDAKGEICSLLTQKYPKLDDTDLIFSLAVMQEGKLMGYHLPARRHETEGEGYVYGMFNSIDESFRQIQDAQVFMAKCTHPYFALNYQDGNITKRCHLCDEIQPSPVGYYVDLTYNANDNDVINLDEKRPLTQRITMLLDGTDKTDKTLQKNPFKYGYHFFSGWQQGDTLPSPDAPVLKPGSEFMPSDTVKGKLSVFAKWNDGFTVNGDTLEVNEDNTADIRIVDNGRDIFGSTADFTAGQISYERQLPEGSRQWGTLCLPFAVASDTTVQYYRVSQTTADGKSLILDEVATTEAGHPYIYRLLGEGTSSLSLSATNAKVTKALTQTDGESVSLIGSYDYLTFECNDKEKSYFAISGDKFIKTDRQITVQPYHAHIEAQTGTAASTRQVLLLLLSSDVENIDIVGADDMEAFDYYDLNGRPVTDLETPGLYIRRTKGNRKAVKIMIQ